MRTEHRPRHYVLTSTGSLCGVTALEWAKYFESKERPIWQCQIGRYLVSTVFLGIDYDFSQIGPPLVWETLIFKNGKAYELGGDRYSTQEEAEAGHLSACNLARKWMEAMP